MNEHENRVVLPFDTDDEREQVVLFIGSLRFCGVPFSGWVEDRGPVGGRDMIFKIEK